MEVDDGRVRYCAYYQAHVWSEEQLGPSVEGLRINLLAIVG